jgi:hypothetical protein
VTVSASSLREAAETQAEIDLSDDGSVTFRVERQ